MITNIKAKKCITNMYNLHMCKNNFDAGIIYSLSIWFVGISNNFTITKYINDVSF